MGNKKKLWKKLAAAWLCAAMIAQSAAVPAFAEDFCAEADGIETQAVTETDSTDLFSSEAADTAEPETAAPQSGEDSLFTEGTGEDASAADGESEIPAAAEEEAETLDFAETTEEPAAETTAEPLTETTTEPAAGTDTQNGTAASSDAPAAEPDTAETVPTEDAGLLLTETDPASLEEMVTDASETAEDDAVAEAFETDETSDETDAVFSSGEDEIEYGEDGSMSGNCGDNGAAVTWKLLDGVMTISGTGAMGNYYTETDSDGNVTEQYTVPWDGYESRIKEVVVEDGVTTVGYGAFAGCDNLTKVTLADSVKTIYATAFAEDSALAEINLGNGIEAIGAEAFLGTAVKSLTLPASLTQLVVSALVGMTSLQEIISLGTTFTAKDGALFADGGKTLFSYAAGLTGSYTVPDGTTQIASYAFTFCSLSSVTVPNTVTEIGTAAFAYSTKLTTLKLSSSQTLVEKYLCYGCTALSSVTIPEGVTQIGNYAFYGCTSLLSVTFPSTVTEIGEGAFPSTTSVTLKNDSLYQLADGTIVEAAKVNVYAKECYKMAFEVLKLVNKERKKAGKSTLKMDKSLLETAMLRSFETVLYWSHTRPVGYSCFTASTLMSGENIAWGATTADMVMEMWMNSSGHKANILSSNYTTIGIGCVYQNGTYYWVQCFGSDLTSEAKSSSYKDKNKTRTVAVAKNKTYYQPSFSLSSSKISVGKTATLSVYWSNSAAKTLLSKSGVVVKSSNTSVLKVLKNGTIKGVGAGTAKITIYFKGYEEKKVTKKITVTGGSLGQAKIKKVSAKSGGSAAVTIASVKGAKGYEIVYSTSSSFKSKKTVTTSKKTATLKNLEAGKTYYIKVRAWKKSGGKKVYGSYSDTKKVKAKA